MADGHTHFKMSLVVDSILAGGLIWMAQEGAPVAVFDGVVVGGIIGTVVTPDFDLVGTTYTEKLLRRIPILGLLLQVSWYPYALLSKHRGLSHTHGLGTLSRFAYMLMLTVVWTWLINGAFLSVGISPIPHLAARIFSYTLSNPAFTVSMLLAWTLHDEAHYLLDGGATKAKKLSPKGQVTWAQLLPTVTLGQSSYKRFSWPSTSAQAISGSLLKSIYIAGFAFGIILELSRMTGKLIYRVSMSPRLSNLIASIAAILQTQSSRRSLSLSPARS